MKPATQKPHVKQELADYTSYTTQCKLLVSNTSTLIYQEYVNIIVLYSLYLIEWYVIFNCKQT